MLSFLKIPVKFVFLVPAIVLSWTLIIGGPVTDLILSIPLMEGTLDLQTPLQFFADIIATLVSAMPWLEVVLDIIIWGIQIKFLVILVDIVFKVINLFVGQ